MKPITYLPGLCLRSDCLDFLTSLSQTGHCSKELAKTGFLKISSVLELLDLETMPPKWFLHGCVAEWSAFIGPRPWASCWWVETDQEPQEPTGDYFSYGFEPLCDGLGV